MIPILYKKDETDFDRIGMPLTECVSCVVTEERNGGYDCELDYPISGVFFSEILPGAIVKAKPNDTSDNQLFRVQKVLKSLNGIMTFYCPHISYELNGLVAFTSTYSGKTAKEIFDAAFAASQSAIGGNSFTFATDIATTNNLIISQPTTIKKLLHGQEGSILDTFGGEYEWDNFDITLHTARGADNGVTIEYGKNLIDLQQEENIASTYNKLVPYAIDETDTVRYLTPKAISISGALDFGYDRALLREFVFGEGETYSDASLLTKANAYLSANSVGTLRTSLSVDFVPVSQTYDDVDLESVSLCDTVTIQYPLLNITTSAKVVKTEYDCLSERYKRVDIGEVKTGIAEAIEEL